MMHPPPCSQATSWVSGWAGSLHLRGRVLRAAVQHLKAKFAQGISLTSGSRCYQLASYCWVRKQRESQALLSAFRWRH